MSRAARLWTVLGLNLGFVAVLAITGIAAHSLGVLAEGVDYLADTAAIGVSLWAIWLSERPVSRTRPNGYPQATTWAALVNSGWLLTLAAFVAAGAIARLVRGAGQVHGIPVLVVSAVAAATMLAGVAILRGDEADDDDEGGALNMRAVLLDTCADAAAAGAVAITGAIIIASSAFWLDPAVALLIAVAVAVQAVMLLRRVTANLRRGSVFPSRH